MKNQNNTQLLHKNILRQTLNIRQHLSNVRYRIRGFFKPTNNCALMLGLTNRCQCSCVHCGTILYKEEKRELTFPEVIRLINESAYLGFRWLYFCGGEPLLVLDLLTYIKHAVKKGFITTLDTNGLLLDEGMVKRLKQAKLSSIGISLDSPYAQVHDSLRGVTGTFSRAIKSIEYCKKHDLCCYVSTYATKDNLRNGELIKLIDLAKTLEVPVRILSSIKSGKWVARQDIVFSPEDIVLVKNLLEKDKVYWWENDDKTKPFECLAYKKRFLYVNVYGDVQPCCYIPISFGNIREEALFKIIKRMWDSFLYSKDKKDKYIDCPANSLDLGEAIANKKNYPLDYEDYINHNKAKERLFC